MPRLIVPNRIDGSGASPLVVHFCLHDLFRSVDDFRHHRHSDQKDLGLTDTQFGLLVGTPILTGSLIRLILGIWSDQYGGRLVFLLSCCRPR